MLKPGSVVKSKVVMVDFGKIMFVPERYGVICSKVFAPDWFGVHWGEDYMCHVGPGDVEEVPETKVARIFDGVEKVSKCAYCSERETPS